MVELILEALDRERERKGLGSFHLQRYKAMKEYSSLGNPVVSLDMVRA